MTGKMISTPMPRHVTEFMAALAGWLGDYVKDHPEIELDLLCSAMSQMVGNSIAYYDNQEYRTQLREACIKNIDYAVEQFPVDEVSMIHAKRQGRQ